MAEGQMGNQKNVKEGEETAYFAKQTKAVQGW
jgi:hypothetical protein